MIKIFDAMLLLVAFIVILSTASADRQTYIVRLDKAKITNTFINSIGNSKPWHEVVLDSIADDVSSQEEQELQAKAPELVYSYETTFFGFAAKLSSKQLESLKKVDGFVTAIPDQMLSLHTTHSPQFLGLEGSKGSLWHSSSKLQSDVIIGVIDTGIWPEHDSFKDHGMPPIPARWKGSCEKGTKFSPSNCNKKLIGARYFSKGYLASGGKINQTEENLSARDDIGHGTHTASTAAGNLVPNASLFGLANGTAAGISYTARIAMYKACWGNGCTASDILAAILAAVEDGVDVLSLSLGSHAEPYHEDHNAIGAFFAFASGVFVSFSAGNSGPFESTAANTAPWIMTVAASTTDRSFPAFVKLGDGEIFEGTTLYTGKATKQLPIVYGKTAGTVSKGAEYCMPGSLNPKLVKGKIVICGFIGSTEMGEQVKLAGGVGMVTVNFRDEDVIADAHILPEASLGALASEAVTKYVNSTKSPTASIAFKGTSYGNRAPMVAAFSSRGPNLVGLDVIKPDVTAPGVNILAAFPAVISPSFLKSDKRRVEFDVMSGTSMSCPHVAGIAALLKSKHKNWSPAAIKSAIMTTAYTTDNRGKPIADLAVRGSEATPFAMGSGHVDPVKASDPGLIYDIATEDYLHYLCSLKYSAAQMALFSEGFTCPEKATMQPGDLNYPSFAVNFKGKARNVTFTYKRTVTNVGILPSTYKVSVEEPRGVSITVKPSVLSFKKLGEKLSYKVSFVGLKTGESGGSSFGSLVWVSKKYRVRSPIAVTWR
ncbi:hypothetical protein COLO4_12647 [Corchorus olitorius]|uniref:Peptidase S8/S53 domain-containing protein n=1 Tax=Corchorus olitorius TaxID=93759 RepID=A0A1R3K078_9ROSI|nr:hypothetical protein COLO4_12647 [Corchorus olitorius]